MSPSSPSTHRTPSPNAKHKSILESMVSETLTILRHITNAFNGELKNFDPTRFSDSCSRIHTLLRGAGQFTSEEQHQLIDAVEYAIITVLLTAVRQSDVFFHPSMKEAKALFELVDAYVNRQGDFRMQLRMAAIQQLFPDGTPEPPFIGENFTHTSPRSAWNQVDCFLPRMVHSVSLPVSRPVHVIRRRVSSSHPEPVFPTLFSTSPLLGSNTTPCTPVLGPVVPHPPVVVRSTSMPNIPLSNLNGNRRYRPWSNTSRSSTSLTPQHTNSFLFDHDVNPTFSSHLVNADFMATPTSQSPLFSPEVGTPGSDLNSSGSPGQVQRPNSPLPSSPTVSVATINLELDVPHYSRAEISSNSLPLPTHEDANLVPASPKPCSPPAFDSPLLSPPIVSASALIPSQPNPRSLSNANHISTLFEGNSLRPPTDPDPSSVNIPPSSGKVSLPRRSTRRRRSIRQPSPPAESSLGLSLPPPARRKHIPEDEARPKTPVKKTRKRKSQIQVQNQNQDATRAAGESGSPGAKPSARARARTASAPGAASSGLGTGIENMSIEGGE